MPAARGPLRVIWEGGKGGEKGRGGKGREGKGRKGKGREESR